MTLYNWTGVFSPFPNAYGLEITVNFIFASLLSVSVLTVFRGCSSPHGWVLQVGGEGSVLTYFCVDERMNGVGV